MPRRKKAAQNLIEDFVTRKTCYNKRRASLLKKMEDLTTLCAVDSCAIIDGPGDDVPTVWPSHDKARELLDKFENAPLTDRWRKNVTPQIYVEQKNKKIENQLAMLKEKNDGKDMSIFMHKIHHDGKSLSDFDASDISRLLCYVEGKLKGVREKTGHTKHHELSPNPPTPPVSCPLKNDIGSQPNTDEPVFEQSTLDLKKEDATMNNGVDNNIGSNNNMGLPPPPHTHLGDVDMVLHQDQVNFEGFNHGDVDMVLPPGNFGGLIDESGSSGVLPQGNFTGLNGNSDSGFLYGSYFGEIGGSDLWPSYGNFGGTIGQHDENQGGSINNIGLWGHQSNFGANNDAVAVGRSSNYPNFVEGSDIEWPTFEGFFSSK
uniref:MADS-box transcription factor PHERES 2 n=1 Tax=Cajanus cajan TaxID=3821 RepID=A0A151SQ59_CAJCA|nr:MADS-box transcription factor PHERES 2 [Cajanus cajan]